MESKKKNTDNKHCVYQCARSDTTHLPIAALWYFLLVIVTLVAPLGIVRILFCRKFLLGVRVYWPVICPMW